MTDFRALCARMADELDHYRQLLMDDRRETHALAAEARAALAQPEPQGPSKRELFGLLMQAGGVTQCVSVEWLEPFADAILARWGTPAIEPEPEGPTESDVTELFYRHMGEGSQIGFENAIAEALSRWGRPAIEPLTGVEGEP